MLNVLVRDTVTLSANRTCTRQPKQLQIETTPLLSSFVRSKARIHRLGALATSRCESPRICTSPHL